MHSGKFRKTVTVISNAKNDPTLRLSLGGTIRADLEYPNYINIIPDEKGEWHSEVILSTEKKDLKVTEVIFKGKGEKADGPGWQNSLSIFPSFKLVKPDSVKADGYYDYKLSFSLAFQGKENKHGDFVIKTNHPKKAEISIRGMIAAKQN